MHIAIAESLDGKIVEWLEHVNDDNTTGRDVSMKRLHGEKVEHTQPIKSLSPLRALGISCLNMPCN